MTNKIVRTILDNRKLATSIAVIAAAVVIGAVAFNVNRQAPDFPEITDPIMEVTLEGEETPLASQPTVTKKTTKKTSTSKKNVKLKEKSAKTYTKKLGTKTTKNSKTVKNANTTVKTDTTVAVTTTEKYKKNKNVKTVTTKTTTTTTVTTTVQPVVVAAQDSSSAAQTVSTSLASSNTTDNAAASSTAASTQSASTSTSTSTSTAATGKYEVSVDSIAPLMNDNVRNAFKTLNFKVIVDPSVNYSGYFDARNQSITMKKPDQSIYHELGHFIAFIAGNMDKSTGFTEIFSNSGEVAKFPGVNKTYGSQNASEYFAESTREFILGKASLVSACPKTASAIQTAIDKITDTQVLKIKKVYAAYWK